LARLFISHSSVNNAAAIALGKWLSEQGFDDVFLDVDPDRGLAPGERWQEALRAAADRCEAVLFLVSPAWLVSKWCLAEFLLAKSLHKRIFGLIIDPVPFERLPPEMTAEWQLCELVGEDRFRSFDVVLNAKPERVLFREAGLDLLRRGLERAGLDARRFPWPPPGEPTRTPYRGLRALEQQDAAIFFGRDAAIVRGLDRIRGLVEGGVEKLLVVLGASGSGKSSFLRAGLWPRLLRDDLNFLALPVIRPESAALSGSWGLAASLSSAFERLGEPRAPGRIKEMLGAGDQSLGRLLDDLLALAKRRLVAADDTKADPAIILPIDQAEELFNEDASEEAKAFLKALSAVLTRPSSASPSSRRILALATIRSDRYELLQTAPELASVKQDLFNLPPVPQSELKSVIEGPARRVQEAGGRLTIDPTLAEQLIADSQGADAMPLLGFTLERLYEDYGSEHRLTVAHYQAIGAVKGAIEAAIAQALLQPTRSPAIPTLKEAQLGCLRSALIPWLARVDYETGAPVRRVARMEEIPEGSRSIVKRLVDARLLVADRRSGIDVVEVAHESLLRQWSALTSWLVEDAGLLNIMDAIKRAAREWAANKKDSSWLAHTKQRLEAAERLCDRRDLAGNLDSLDREYLVACRAIDHTSRRRSRAVQVVFGALLVGLIALGWFGYGGFLDPTYLEGRVNLVRNNLREANLKPGDAVSECANSCPEMVVVPAGRYSMGSTVTNNEQPPHEVSIRTPLLVSRTDITFDQWDACVRGGGCGYSPSDEGWGRGSRPVINVSWDDLQPYLAWLTKVTGKSYRLLSETEWEYAARAGGTSKYYWGDEPRPNGQVMANCADCGSQWDLHQSSPAGSFPANGFGLEDMLGNVSQIVADPEHDSYNGAPSDGSVWRDGGVSSFRIVRGGAWFALAADLRVSLRGFINTHDRGQGIGFRVARALGENLVSANALSVSPVTDRQKEELGLRDGKAILLDGFANYSRSGFSFRTGQMVAWNSLQGDILVAIFNKTAPYFFMPGTELGVANPGEGDIVQAGIVKMNVVSLDQIRACPTAGFQVGWYKPDEGGLYCVRIRDGRSYAKILVTDIGKDTIKFRWVYNPSGEPRF
jgi:formylglycine-generating enzyme required for sulfatase activity